jgi:hypothetical protein
MLSRDAPAQPRSRQAKPTREVSALKRINSGHAGDARGFPFSTTYVIKMLDLAMPGNPQRQ